ncbi:MAG: hypothetical protein ACI9OF_002755, partial [Saprospiraceae bacterium]
MKTTLIIATMMLLLAGCVMQTQHSGRQVADKEKQVQALVDLGVGY